MKEFLITFSLFGSALALFYLRVRQAGGWLLLGKVKLQKAFPNEEED